MHLGHFSINTMSLLGLSLSVGLLIDDAIVVVENIIRHRQMGKDARQAALDGTQEIVLPVVATTLSVAAADQSLEAVRAALADVPEVAHVYQRSDAQQGSFFVTLVPKAERGRTQQQVMSDCRACINALAGFQADFGSEEEKPLAISIVGDDMTTLEAISHEAEGVLRTIPGVRDVTSSVRTGATELKVVCNDAIANELGVSTNAIGETLGTLMNGTVVGRYSDKDEQVDIRLRLAGSDRATSAMLQQVYVPGKDDHLVPLAQVASVEQGAASGSVRRYDRQKEVRLTANLENTALSDVDAAFWAQAAAIELRLRPILMTSLAMIFGMLPIALGAGGGAELRAPMAYAIIGGIVTSTVLTLVIVPIAYTWIYHFTHRKEKEPYHARQS